ncbi:MAG: LytTR family DNA-binding domain-containing protein [Candidatus Izemoplasmatales bacterium]|uniref:LytTR family transcriptional regulator n=1 Tax=Hujiaoplasma nucleasis TaxID=2725268 RepID=A0A7L6N399_9MOLU|nr:LytTR family DNA-binding domain-containing protein [Hujiaoplasma nucleasis]QLY40740.1 LytTR family transcriptional regulator [Hujiaoplasma nucleasis]
MITYKIDKETYTLNHEDAIYFYSYDDDTFCRMSDKTVQVNNRLYEIEDELMNHGFIRISKWNVVNFNLIHSAFRIFNSRMSIKMINGDKLYVNRTYIKKFILYLKEKGEING